MGLKDWWWEFLRPVFHCWYWYYHFAEYYYQNTWLSAYYWVVLYLQRTRLLFVMLILYYLSMIYNMHSSESIVYVAINYLKVHSFVHNTRIRPLYSCHGHPMRRCMSHTSFRLPMRYCKQEPLEMHETTSQHTLWNRVNSNNRWQSERQKTSMTTQSAEWGWISKRINKPDDMHITSSLLGPPHSSTRTQQHKTHPDAQLKHILQTRTPIPPWRHKARKRPW